MFNQSIPILRASLIENGLEFEFSSKTFSDFGELIILIHNHSLTPITVYFDGDYTSSGSYYYYSVEKTLVQKLPQPYNDYYQDLTQFTLNRVPASQNFYTPQGF